MARVGHLLYHLCIDPALAPSPLEHRHALEMNTTLRIALYGLIVAVVRVLAGPSGAHAENVAEGGRLAQSLCSRCHVVTPDGPAGWTNAPSFAAIANKPTATSASLQAIIQKPHMKMSSLAQRNPSEAADLAAYILTLKQK